MYHFKTHTLFYTLKSSSLIIHTFVKIFWEILIILGGKSVKLTIKHSCKLLYYLNDLWYTTRDHANEIRLEVTLSTRMINFRYGSTPSSTSLAWLILHNNLVIILTSILKHRNTFFYLWWRRGRQISNITTLVILF